MTTAIATNPKWKVLTTEVPGSPAWLEAHEGRYGSNAISTIMGVNPHQSRIKLFAEMTGKIPRDDLSNLPHIRRGVLLEPVIAKLFTAETGREIIQTPGLVQHPTLPMVAVTPDGLTDGGATVAEFKSLKMYKRKDWKADVPLHVQIQGQAMLWVLGLAKVTFGAFCLDEEEDDGDDQDGFAKRTEDPLLLWADRDRRDDLLEVFGNEVVDFHEKYVLKDSPPPPDGDVDVVKAMYPKHAAGTVKQLAAETEIKILRNKELAAIKTAAEKEKKIVVAEILAELGDNEYGETPGGLVVRARTQNGGNYFVEPFTSRPLIVVKKVGA